MIIYTPATTTFHTTADVIDDGDEPKASVLAPAVEAALDNSAYLREHRGRTVGTFDSGAPLITIGSGTHEDIVSLTVPPGVLWNNGRVEAHAVFGVVIPASYIGAIQPVIKQVGGAAAGAEVELTESVVEFSDGGGQWQGPVASLVYFDMSDVAALGPFSADATSFSLVWRGWIPGYVGGPDNYQVITAKAMCRAELY